MDIQITARHFQLENGDKASIREQIHDLIAGCSRNVTAVRVTITFENKLYNTEISLIGARMDLEAKGKAREYMLSFDQAYDKVERQLHKLLDKRNDHRGKSIQEVEEELFHKDEDLDIGLDGD